MKGGSNIPPFFLHKKCIFIKTNRDNNNFLCKKKLKFAIE